LNEDNIMQAIQNLFQRLIREEDGASTVEYAIVVVGVALVAAAAIASFDLNAIFTTVEGRITTIIGGQAAPAAN
jgi:Flp pilus assembly pilin Flp